MAFDPDKYLAKKQGVTNTGFDPDAYLAKKESPQVSTSSQGRDESFADKASGAGQSFMQSFGNTWTLGYLPEMQAGTEVGLNKILPKSMGGQDPTVNYEQSKKQMRARAEDLYKKHQSAGILGGTAAIVNQIPLLAATAPAEAATYLSRLGQASKVGAGFGAAANPETEHNPEKGIVGNAVEEVTARGKNAALGAALGGAFETGITGVKNLFPIAARFSAGIPEEATNEYAKNTKAIDKMIDEPYGYKNMVDEAHAKIQDTQNQQSVEALGEFTEHAAKQHPTSIGPEGIEGRVNNIQSKIDETRAATDAALAQRQAEHEAQLAATADRLKAERDAVVQNHISYERERLNNTVKQQLGTEYIDAGIVQRMDKTAKDLKTALYNKKREVGASIQEGVIKSGQPINIQNVFQPIEDQIDRLSQSGLAQTPAVKAEIDGLIALHKSISEGLGPTLDAESAFLLKDRLKLISKAQNMSGGYGGRSSPNDSAIQKSIQDAGLESYRILNSELDRVADSAGARKEYKKMVDLEDVLENEFSSPEKVMKSVSGLEGPKKVLMRDKVNRIKEMTDGKIDLTDDYKILANYGDLHLPDEKLVPRQLTKQIDEHYAKQQDKIMNGLKKQNEMDTKPIIEVKKTLDRNFATPEKTQKTLELSAKPGAHSSKAAVDKASTILGSDVNADATDIANFKKVGESVESFAKKPEIVGPKTEQYVNTKKIVDEKFSTPEKTFKTLSGYDRKQQKFLKHNVDEISKATGQDLQETSRKLQAYSWFQNPSLLPVSAEGTTSTSRTHGVSALFEMGGGLFGPKGAHIGRAVGRVAGGPAAVKGAIKTGQALSRVLPESQNAAPLFTPWVRMQNKKKEGK